MEENIARFLFYSNLIVFLMDCLFFKEKERMYESRVGRKVGRMWQEMNEGKCSQIIFKNIFTILKENEF